VPSRTKTEPAEIGGVRAPLKAVGKSNAGKGLIWIILQVERANPNSIEEITTTTLSKGTRNERFRLIRLKPAELQHSNHIL
jgi:hypothetical protein